MKQLVGCTIAFVMVASSAFSQVETTDLQSGIFNRVLRNLQEYKLDTTTAPQDKMTKVIENLRNLRGGFNIYEAIDYKLQEDWQKKDISEKEFESLSQYFKMGRGKIWLNNAVTWIYRQHFTLQELKQMVRFYKTTAGQKMAAEFPIIMLKSFAAAEGIRKLYLPPAGKKD